MAQSARIYLSVLLHWLRQSNEAYAALIQRRPDILRLEEDPSNVQEQVPHIALVNEILEEAVGTYHSGDPYLALSQAIYPHNLPYHRPLDEIRALCKFRGTALWKEWSAVMPGLLLVASEYFQLDPLSLALVTGQNRISPTEVWHMPDPLAGLASAHSFLLAADISFEQLVELLTAQTLWKEGIPLMLQAIKQPDFPLIPLSDEKLDRIHRFLRLWRHTGWKVSDLDKILCLLAAQGGVDADGIDISSETLIELFYFGQLLDETQLPLEAVLRWFTPGQHRTESLGVLLGLEGEALSLLINLRWPELTECEAESRLFSKPDILLSFIKDARLLASAGITPYWAGDILLGLEPGVGLEGIHPDTPWGSLSSLIRSLRMVKTRTSFSGQVFPMDFDYATLSQLSAELQPLASEPVLHQVGLNRSAALISFLMARNTGSDTEDILGYYLIDAQPSPWEVVSREAQACTSIQLFIQRCLMEIEPDIQASSFPPGTWLQWETLKSQPLWEANRSAFPTIDTRI
jgi:hypothetical protein